MIRSAVVDRVIGSAIGVHRALGPGLLESVYERCLAHELSLRRVAFVRQVALPVEYKGLRLPWGYRIDLLVERQVIVEVKAVERLLPVHSAQLLTYLRLLKIPHGLLINFNAVRVVEGLRSVVLASAAREKSFETPRS